MTTATTEFFDQLAQRGHEPLLERATGTVAFDLARRSGTDRWLVTIAKGDLSVSRKNLRPDCIIRTDAELFEGIASGRVNTMAAVLRGAVTVEGDLELAVLFQRVFPGPPRSRSTRRTAGGGRKAS